MKQLFLNLTHGAIVNGGTAIANTIRVINSRPAQLFWAPLFAYGASTLILQGFGWNLIPAALLVYWTIRSSTKLFTRKPTAPTVAADPTPVYSTLTQVYDAIDANDVDQAMSHLGNLDPSYSESMVKAAHSRIQDLKMVTVSEARETAAQALSAEAQAVVDRIRERTVRLIPNDPPATIKVQDLPAKRTRKPKLNIVKGDDQ